MYFTGLRFDGFEGFRLMSEGTTAAAVAYIA